MGNIEKAYAISDAKIRFVSLVDKAANKKKFLVTKAEKESGFASFQSFGRILKADQGNHFVTGIVYEPMSEDTDGNYMTAEEIEKAAHWFMKNGGDVDIQHCFQKAEGVDVVESFVAKCDMEMEGQKISKGTWVMTMEVADDSVWNAITKGEITGFSMGGIGNFSQEDVDLGQVEKKSEPKGLFRRLAKSLGMEVVEKGKVKDDYRQRIKSENFWTAYSALENALKTEVYKQGYGYQYVFTDNEDIIRDALNDFNEIVTELLDSEHLADDLSKAAKESKAFEKAGRSLSSSNLATLQGISASLSDFLAGFTQPDDSEEGSGEKMGKSKIKKDKKGEVDMTHEETQELVEKAVAKAIEPIAEQIEALAKAEDVLNGKEGGGDVADGKDIAKKDDGTEEVAKMISDAVAKAIEPVQGQIEAIRKSRALPNNLNGEPGADVLEKSGQHYLHGIL